MEYVYVSGKRRFNCEGEVRKLDCSKLKKNNFKKLHYFYLIIITSVIKYFMTQKLNSCYKPCNKITLKNNFIILTVRFCTIFLIRLFSCYIYLTLCLYKNRRTFKVG